MLLDASIWEAIGWGMLSFLTPCVLPIVLPSLGFLAGVGLAQVAGEEASLTARLRLVATATVFALGFTLMFTGLGVGASAVGQALQEHKLLLQRISGAVLIIMGLHFTGLIRLPFLQTDLKMDAPARRASYVSAFLGGLAFAFGWTACAGGFLARMLFIAADSASMATGATLLFFYGVGIGIPFVLAALFAGPFLRLVKAGGSLYRRVEIVSGVVLILTGALFFDERGFSRLGGALFEAAPEFWQRMI